MRHKRKVVISTGTIALQEQLIGKDIPTLQKAYRGQALVKVAKLHFNPTYASHERPAGIIRGQRTGQEMQDTAAGRITPLSVTARI